MQATKVFHLIDHYLPPSQIWLYNLLANSTDVEHHIGTREFLSNDFYHPGFSFTKSKIGAYHRYLMSSNKGSFISRLEHLLLWPQRWVYPTEEKQWTQYIKENNIQLIHAHFANCACEHMDWVKRTRLPFVVSFYGYDYEKLPFTKKRFIKLYQQLFQYADSILCEGPHGVKILTKMGCPASKLKVVPLGIDRKEWQLMPNKTKEQGTLKLLQIANFTPKKGQLDTIKAAILAKKHLPSLQLTLVGALKNEHYFNACLQLIQQAENKDWIKYIPFVAYQKMKDLISSHDVFIHPSKYGSDKDCEGGAPTVLYNVQAMGMPVISTQHCDIPFVAKDGASAMLSDEGDIDALVTAIHYFYEQEENTFSLWQKNTYEWAKHVGNIEESAAALSANYETLITK